MLGVINTAARFNRMQRRIWLRGTRKSLKSNRSLCLPVTPLASRHFYDTPQAKRQIREYEDVFKKSIEDPEGFWGAVSEDIDWYSPYDRVMDNSNPPFTKWFVGAKMNTCYNCVDRHVDKGKGTHTALIYDSPLTGKVEMYSYQSLQDLVAKFAGALASLNVSKGDRVVIYMPMVPQAVVAMLACTRLGAVHSVVFGGFAAQELARRIEHAEPRVVVTASCGLEPTRMVYYKPLLDEAIRLSSHKPATCIVYQREQVK